MCLVCAVMGPGTPHSIAVDDAKGRHKRTAKHELLKGCGPQEAASRGKYWSIPYIHGETMAGSRLVRSVL